MRIKKMSIGALTDYRGEKVGTSLDDEYLQKLQCPPASTDFPITSTNCQGFTANKTPASFSRIRMKVSRAWNSRRKTRRGTEKGCLQ
jgi:hypothetical protein